MRVYYKNGVKKAGVFFPFWQIHEKRERNPKKLSILFGEMKNNA